MDKNKKETESVDRLVEDVFTRLPQLFKRMHRIRHSLFEKRPGWDPQMQLMLQIRKHGELGMSEICERLSLLKSNVTPLVDKLIEQGMAERTHAEKDRRQVLVRLTHAGSVYVDEFRQETQRIFTDLLGKMGPSDIELLRATMDNLVHLIDRFEEAKEIRLREVPDQKQKAK